MPPTTASITVTIPKVQAGPGRPDPSPFDPKPPPPQVQLPLPKWLPTRDTLADDLPDWQALGVLADALEQTFQGLWPYGYQQPPATDPRTPPHRHPVHLPWTNHLDPHGLATFRAAQRQWRTVHPEPAYGPLPPLQLPEPAPRPYLPADDDPNGYVRTALEASVQRGLWRLEREVSDSAQARKQWRAWSSLAARTVPPALAEADRLAELVNTVVIAPASPSTTPHPRRHSTW